MVGGVFEGRKVWIFLPICQWFAPFGEIMKNEKYSDFWVFMNLHHRHLSDIWSELFVKIGQIDQIWGCIWEFLHLEG